MSYNPRPPRVWSRVQNRCTFTDNNSYNSVYSPLTGKTTSLLEADYYDKLLYKGNILQYKKNTSNLTKSQRYSQICKGMWTNRTKSYATQTQSYTNPNTSNLKQVNFINVPSNGNTTYIPGPFNFNIPSPNGCISDTIKDGGSLLCNTVVNPCTDDVVETTTVLECYPTYCSDVPGAIIDLCWNPKLDTWYPRQNLTMNNSTDKWPEGYKGLVSAVTPVAPNAPYLMIDISGNVATLTWKIIFNVCIPINSFNIYENGQIIANVPYTTTSYNISTNCGNKFFYVTSVSTAFESGPSNTVLFNNIPFTTTGGPVSYTVDSNCNYVVTFTGSGTIIFNNNNSVNYTVTGGGGNGGNGPNGNPSNAAGGGGGGGGGGTNTGNFVPTANTSYTITVGTSTTSSSISSIIISPPGTNGNNGNSSTGGGGSGGLGGTPAVIPGQNGQTGQTQQGVSGGAGGAGGAGYNSYGNGGNGGKGGDTDLGPGQNGFPGGHGVVVLSFTG